MLGRLCAIVTGSDFHPRNFGGKRKSRHWEVGKITRPPSAFSNPVSAKFCSIALRQNAQGRGSAEGSKKEQDKRRASQATPA